MARKNLEQSRPYRYQDLEATTPEEKRRIWLTVRRGILRQARNDAERQLLERKLNEYEARQRLIDSANR